MLITLHFREVKNRVVTRGKPFLINVDHIEVVRPTAQYETSHSDIFTPSDPTEQYPVFESMNEVQNIVSGLVSNPPK
ncbi:hypothetical protein [Enterococcus spodopteracolus]|uniref:hypothetical protein n=1 Tax=Enterococcus spodopteracolus TaxID=3034501 RepID=UPI002649A7BA|nr:hypothetical protein [Enterococcus spodopteracolus]